MISGILTWFEQEATLLQAIAAGTAILGFGGPVFWAVVRFIRGAVTKPKPVQVETTVRLADDLPVLTPVQWIRTQEVMRESIFAQLDRADDEERKRLQARVDELTARINDPEGAFEAERKRLADLEEKLVREGNELGAERLNSAVAKLRAGNTDEAEAIFSEIAAREAMAVQRVARAEFGLGEIAESRVEWRAAAQRYARAAELDPSYDTLGKAGELLWRAGKYDAALETNKRLVALSKEEYGARDPKTATALNNYAELLHATERHAEAEPLFRESVEIGRETLGDRHPYVACYINNLARVLSADGRSSEAEPLFRQALEIGRETLGDRHPDVAVWLNNLAKLLRVTGRVAEAEPLAREALEITRITLGHRHPAVATRLNNLAGLLEATGRAGEATPLYLEATAISRAALGDDHPKTQTVARNTLIHLRDHAPDHPDRAGLESVFAPPDMP